MVSYGKIERQTTKLGVGGSNPSGRASLRDIPCESHGIHTATVPWKPGTCAADFGPIGLRIWGSGVRIFSCAPTSHLKTSQKLRRDRGAPIGFSAQKSNIRPTA